MAAQPVPVEAEVLRRAGVEDRTAELDRALVQVAELERAVDHRVAVASIAGPAEAVDLAG